MSREHRERGKHRELLVGTPAEVLTKIARGDPLRLRRAIAASLRARCQILDGDLVLVRALAVCADRADEGRAARWLLGWIRSCVEEAVDTLLEEDARPHPEESSTSSQVERRTAFRRFNRRPHDERRAFYSLLIHRRSIDELAHENRTSVTLCAQRARRAWLALTLDHAG